MGGNDADPGHWGNSQLIAELRRQLSGLQTENQRLRNELDAYQGRTVFFTTDGHLDEAMIASFDAEPGTVLRATDTGRELILTAAGGWEPWIR